MGPNPSNFISVIIPSYNNRFLLERCLNALFKQSYPENFFEIIVVDNMSTDGTEDFVKSLSKVRYCKCEKEGSYAARNVGVNQANGDVLAFTDSDCIPDSNWLISGLRVLELDPKVGLVAGAIEMYYENLDQPNLFETYDTIFGLQQEKFVETFGFAATANLFVKKQVLISLGLFNSNLFSAGDRDLGRKNKEAGNSIVYAENALVKHKARSTLASLNKQTNRHLGGYFQEKDTKLSSLVNVLSGCRHLLGGIRRVWSMESMSYALKIKVTFVALLLKISNLYELIFLLIGQKAKRV